MMTELERARMHLREAQDALGKVRLSIGHFGSNSVPGLLESLDVAERCVLAALSWVWEEQQREAGCVTLSLKEQSIWRAQCIMAGANAVRNATL